MAVIPMAVTPSRARWRGWLLVPLSIAACGQPAKRQPPHVILIVMDTLRADYLSFHGDAQETMPFVASLAAEGMVFEHAISSSSWTAPSTATLLTGVYADRHGVQQGFLANLSQLEAARLGPESMQLNRISKRTPSLAEHFQASGYATLGLASNINIGAELGFDRGFDRFERHDEWPAEKLHERLLEWKAELQTGRPFFLYLHLNDVHKPYERREAWFVETPELPEKGLYRSEMGYLDHWIERMLLDLEAGPNTLLVLSSDHGEEFMERGSIGHHMSLHTEVNRIVMLFHGPALGIQVGKSMLEVSGIDLAPSVAELAGISASSDRFGDALDGSSLAPFMLADMDARIVARRSRDLAGRALIGHREGSRKGNLYSVVKGRWKLIQKRGIDYLYDLETDPFELNNVRDTNPERYRDLVLELERYQARDFQLEADSTQVEFDDALLHKLNDLGYTEH